MKLHSEPFCDNLVRRHQDKIQFGGFMRIWGDRIKVDHK